MDASRSRDGDLPLVVRAQLTMKRYGIAMNFDLYPAEARVIARSEVVQNAPPDFIRPGFCGVRPPCRALGNDAIRVHCCCFIPKGIRICERSDHVASCPVLATHWLADADTEHVFRVKTAKAGLGS